MKNCTIKMSEKIKAELDKEALELLDYLFSKQPGNVFKWFNIKYPQDFPKARAVIIEAIERMIFPCDPDILQVAKDKLKEAINDAINILDPEGWMEKNKYRKMDA